MVIKKVKGDFLTLPVKSGSTVSTGDAVYINNGEAERADKDTEKHAYGFARHIQGTNVIVQTSGVIPKTVSVGSYWLGSNGTITNTIPTTGLVQEIAKGLNNNKLLITIDRTVIIL